MAATASYFILVVSFPSYFARIFTNDLDLVNIASNILPIYMGGMWLFGVQMTAQSYFVGTGQSLKSLLIALLRKVFILIPLVFILPLFFGVKGVFYSEPIADITSATVSGILLFLSLRTLKKKQETLK